MLERTKAGDALSKVAVQIMYLNGIITQAGDGLAEKAGQSSARWRVLAACEHKVMTVAECARALGLARQSVQRLADVLTEEGFTVYKDNENDQRAKLLALTPLGQKKLSLIQSEQIKWANHLGEKLGRNKLSDLSQQLQNLIETLEKENT